MFAVHVRKYPRFGRLVLSCLRVHCQCFLSLVQQTPLTMIVGMQDVVLSLNLGPNSIGPNRRRACEGKRHGLGNASYCHHYLDFSTPRHRITKANSSESPAQSLDYVELEDRAVNSEIHRQAVPTLAWTSSRSRTTVSVPPMPWMKGRKVGRRLAEHRHLHH
jgi:hypothetical protein